MSDENVDVGSSTDLLGDMITEEEAAKMLGRSRAWLRNMRLEGEGPVYVDLGNTIRYNPEDVRDWLFTRRKTPTKVARKPRPKKAAASKTAATKTRKPIQE